MADPSEHFLKNHVAREMRTNLFMQLQSSSDYFIPAFDKRGSPEALKLAEEWQWIETVADDEPPHTMRFEGHVPIYRFTARGKASVMATYPDLFRTPVMPTIIGKNGLERVLEELLFRTKLGSDDQLVADFRVGIQDFCDRHFPPPPHEEWAECTSCKLEITQAQSPATFRLIKETGVCARCTREPKKK